ncbi:MAG: hypothetical protein JSW55_01770 [Chloroflexota bacterium]|nr:MAG: hypothetical protein JSW55_01770 [Chloroflexota bacterium]
MSEPFSATVNGDCSVAHIRFATKQEATTALSFDNVVLADPDGLPIAANLIGTELTIGGKTFVYVPLVLWK